MRTAIATRLEQWAQRRGYRIAVGTSAVLDDVADQLAELRRVGALDEAFARANLDGLQLSRQADPAGVTTLLLVAVPRPAHTVVFDVNGRELEAVLPPTYHRYSTLSSELQQDLLTNVFTDGVQLQVLEAPLKSLAARLGLVEYGRNNLTYAPGLGSYFQLAGFLADADCGELARIPAPPRALPACKSCRACQNVCPTGAIDRSRFLLHAEYCLTLFSENAGPFPVDSFPPCNRCLAGCLDCQQVCPVNKGRLRFEPTGIRFSAQETAAILDSSDCRTGEIWEAIRAKLRELVLFDCEAILGRNLRALIARTGANQSESARAQVANR